MDYIRIEEDGQMTFTQSLDYLRIPSCLYDFTNESTSTSLAESGSTMTLFDMSRKPYIRNPKSHKKSD